MATYDHGSQAIADSYAKTLLDLTQAAGTTGAVQEEFRAFAKLMETDAAFAEFMTSQSVDADRRALVLEKHFRGRMNDLLLSTLQVINRKGRTELIPLIFEQYRLAVEEVNNEVDVLVTSAVPLTDALRQRLAETATKVAGKTARLVETVDPAILGGLVVRIGDEKLDASVARHLQRLGNVLHERAVHEIHAGKAFVESNGG
ncbi:MAG TPA: ATP synthase F1 subunit delta [Phycisphaerae bacterium]|nr:ATP synthase F1 subunit delta [Phycisphaerales bacterium]HRX85307.1 ATP synthase F1 subunit delta [Phycisphaerae bacterium]